MVKQLIVNADGFGFTFGNNRGILECLPNGIVKSVSINANFNAVEESCLLTTQFPHVSTGIHFCLTAGYCVADPDSVPALVESDGRFLGKAFDRKVMTGRIPYNQIVRELSAQVERLLALGVKISHIDGHQNKHLLPPFFHAAIDVAKKYGINRMRTHYHYLTTVRGQRLVRTMVHMATHPVRFAYYTAERGMMHKARKCGFRMAERLITPTLLDGTRKCHRVFWEQLFRRLPDGVSEVFCHPGYPDETLRANASYVEGRLRELEFLSDPALFELGRKCGVDFVSFWDI